MRVPMHKHKPIIDMFLYVKNIYGVLYVCYLKPNEYFYYHSGCVNTYTTHHPLKIIINWFILCVCVCVCVSKSGLIKSLKHSRNSWNHWFHNLTVTHKHSTINKPYKYVQCHKYHFVYLSADDYMESGNGVCLTYDEMQNVIERVLVETGYYDFTSPVRHQTVASGTLRSLSVPYHS